MPPTIITDTREQNPLSFKTFPTEAATLATGDYSVKGLQDIMTIERKSIPDLIGSLTTGRDRFQREIQRMLAYRFRTLLVIGDGTCPRGAIARGEYRSKASPQSILASLASIEAKGVAVKYSPTAGHAAQWLESVAWYAWRAQQIAAGNTTPKTPASILKALAA